MMKKIRMRNSVLGVVILSCALVFAGCGSSEQGADEQEKNAQTEAENREELNVGEESAGEATTEVTETLVAYPVKTPVTVDLDGDGKEEQVQIWYEEDNNFPIIQIDDILFGDDFWTAYYIDNPERNQWYLVDTDTEDGYKEIGLFDEGPSDDPYTVLLRYEDGKLRYIGGFTSYPNDAKIAGDGIIYATQRMDILETNFAEGRWELENGDSFESAQLQLQVREVYEILSYQGRWNGEYCPVTAGTMQMFIGQDLTAEMVVLDPGEMVIPYRYYPDGENGWVELAYGKDFQLRGFVYINGHSRIYQVGEAGEVLYVNSYDMLDGLLFAD